MTLPKKVGRALREGVLIPAHPLALDRSRKLDERRQRALTRYYIDAGAGGLAVGVHTTQFAIREKKVGLLRPVLELAAETVAERKKAVAGSLALVAGVCGPTRQAVEEAQLARELGYHAGLLSLAALQRASVPELIQHARAVAEVLPVFGFYLQPTVGGRELPYEFWRRFCEIEGVVAIKIAPFDRYRTLDVVRAVIDSGRGAEIALYTGNDDNILVDLVTRFRLSGEAAPLPSRIVGGLLGHWAVWTRRSVEHFREARRIANRDLPVPQQYLELAQQVTDANGALFDAANGYAGCIAGLHEVLRRQGLLEGVWLLDPDEGLSPWQIEEIDRVYRAYPHLNDDPFVAQRLDAWLA